MFGDYMNLLRVSLQQKHTGPVMTGEGGRWLWMGLAVTQLQGTQEGMHAGLFCDCFRYSYLPPPPPVPLWQAMDRPTRAAAWPMPLACRAPATASTPPAPPPWWPPTTHTGVRGEHVLLELLLPCQILILGVRVIGVVILVRVHCCRGSAYLSACRRPLSHAGILGGESAAALAAGINIMAWHETTVGICQLQVGRQQGWSAGAPRMLRQAKVALAVLPLPMRSPLAPPSGPLTPSRLLPSLPTLQALSPVGRCQSFDSAADGYGRGEGFAAVVLTQHGVASTADGHVWAHIRGSAVNQDGRSSSLTAPNGPSQQALLGTALAAGTLHPVAVGLVAVHGTGTPLGDPIEVGALAAALGGAGGKNGASRMLSLASVKSCYGHTEGTAGITGLLLAAGAAQQQLLPPIVNLRSMNPYVGAALSGFGGSNGSGSSVALPRQAAPSSSSSSGASPVAGTSSFGMSGVNAHVLLSPAAGAPAPSEGASGLPWELQRFWPVPQQHRLLQLPRLGGPGAVRFAGALSSTAALGYLWDHTINGRPLLVGASMLEMAGAAAAMLADAAVPALQAAVAGAAFVAPCLLPPTGSGWHLVLEVAVNSRSGAMEVQSAVGSSLTTHLTARAVALSAPTPAVAGTDSSKASALLAATLLHSAPSSGQQLPAATSCAAITAPSSDATAAYHQHPAATDASLHLSALTSQLLGGVSGSAAARIPVAAGLCATPSRIASSGCSGGWTVVKVSGVCGVCVGFGIAGRVWRLA